MQLDECNQGISMFSFIQFAYIKDQKNSGNDWYNFKSIENLPNDLKYLIK